MGLAVLPDELLNIDWSCRSCRQNNSSFIPDADKNKGIAFRVGSSLILTGTSEWPRGLSV